jgi:hypothetical protein
MDIFEEYN